MKYISIISVLSLVLGAVSCGKLEGGTEILQSGQVIGIIPVGAKAALESGAVTEDYTIYLSSYFNNVTDETGANYFTAKPFHKVSGNVWSASPSVFWPLGGTLDMLAIAADADDIDIEAAAVWYGENVTKGVEISVPDRSCLNSELCYSIASSHSTDSRNVELMFRHSQTRLVVNVDPIEELNTVRVDSIVVIEPYLGGKLRIKNGTFLDATWDFHNTYRHSYSFPEFVGTVVGAEKKTAEILLPEQDACEVVVYYTKKSSDEPSWSNYIERTSYRCPASREPWYSGKKYVINLDFGTRPSSAVSVSSFEKNYIPSYDI